MRTLVTGSSGFIGFNLCSKLMEEKKDLVVASRSDEKLFCSSVKQVKISNIDKKTVWKGALSGVDVVIHSAATIESVFDSFEDQLRNFRKVNRDGTLNLAMQAQKMGVKRFIFLSTMKVNGEFTTNKPFSPNDEFVSSDPYAISKYEAEKKLLELSKVTDMEVVIIRPPIVYGPRMKNNFLLLFKLVKKGFPLPFLAVNNKRAFLAIDNLISFLLLCSDVKNSPCAKNNVFLLSDASEVSLKDVLKLIAERLNKKIFLFYVPVSLMSLIAKLLGKKSVSDKMFNSFEVDSSKAFSLLGWRPHATMSEQFKKIDINNL